MTITQMTALLAVLDYGGFTEAGKRLFMTQSAVSQAISAIEDELQVKIFIRQRARAIRLTPVGERIVSHFRKVMQEVSAIKEIAALEKTQPVSWLHIGCFPSACACILPPIVRYFTKHHPHIHIIPHEANGPEIIDAVRTGEFSAGLVHFPVTSLYSHAIYKDKFTVVVPAGHPFAARASLTLEDLVNQPLIISKGRYELTIMSLFQARNITPQIRYEFNHPGTAISFIRQGLGIALLPELTLKAVEHTLCSVPLEPDFYRHISLIAQTAPTEGSPVLLLSNCLQNLVESRAF